jgi:hypothetical protein
MAAILPDTAAGVPDLDVVAMGMLVAKDRNA